MTLDIGSLRDWLAESLVEDAPNFITVGIDCKDAADAEALSTLLSGSFDADAVQVSRAGVHAVALVTGNGSASAILSWQGEKPEGSESTEDESDSE